MNHQETTPHEAAIAASDALRNLNHLTLSYHGTGWGHPRDAYAVVGRWPIRPAACPRPSSSPTLCSISSTGAGIWTGPTWPRCCAASTTGCCTAAGRPDRWVTGSTTRIAL